MSTSSERPTRILYFTVVPLWTGGNGGGLCCRNHVDRLAADPAIELFVITAYPPGQGEGTAEFLEGRAHGYRNVAFRQPNIFHEANTVRSVASFAWKATFQFPWELQALNQQHVEAEIAAALREWSIDVLVIDYHPSALFVRLPRSDVRTALIGLNREGDFYEQQITLGHTHHGSLTAGISLGRVRRWERRINAAVDQPIAIGPPDLPRGPTRRPPVCMTPYLDPKPEGWRYEGTGRVFFVGAIGHYPNRLAIDWLTRELAPQLAALGSKATVTIIGAGPQDIPKPYRAPNVELLGTSDAATVASLFRSCDLMVCPVENDFGVKFKGLEALAFGTPLAVSRQTKLGLPHHRNLVVFDLEQPAEAASTIAGLVGNSARLEALAVAQREDQDRFIGSQQGAWGRLLKALL